MKFRRPTLASAPVRALSRSSRADLKTPEEIEAMRATGRLARRVIEETSKRLAPGVTTGELEDFAVRILTEAAVPRRVLAMRREPIRPTRLIRAFRSMRKSSTAFREGALSRLAISSRWMSARN